ncbi:MAG: hypothetical protein WCQ99_10680 [Pseudomonadota bacterium]
MKCIIYEKKSGIIAGQIIGLLKALAVENKAELYSTIKKISRRLSVPVEDGSVVLLIAGDRQDLLAILSMQKLLSGIRVIIILPDREDESVKLGYTLQPRFLTYVNGDLTEVHAVLKKMLELSESKEILAKDS